MPTKLCWHSCWLCELSWAAGTAKPRKGAEKGEKAQKEENQTANWIDAIIERSAKFKKEKSRRKRKKNIQISHGELEKCLENVSVKKVLATQKDNILPDICRPKRDKSPLDYLRIWNSPCSWDISERTLRLETRPPSSRKRSTSIIDHPSCWRHPTVYLLITFSILNQSLNHTLQLSAI